MWTFGAHCLFAGQHKALSNNLTDGANSICVKRLILAMSIIESEVTCRGFVTAGVYGHIYQEWN